MEKKKKKKRTKQENKKKEKEKEVHFLLVGKKKLKFRIATSSRPLQGRPIGILQDSYSPKKSHRIPNGPTTSLRGKD